MKMKTEQEGNRRQSERDGWDEKMEVRTSRNGDRYIPMCNGSRYMLRFLQVPE